MAVAPGPRGEERTPDRLPGVPGAWLGRGERSDGSGLQGARSAGEGVWDALGESGVAGGGDAESAGRQRPGLVGGLLEAATTRSRLLIRSITLNCSPSLPRSAWERKA